MRESIIYDSILRFFPTPSFVTMPAVGVNISDHSIKMLELIRGARGLKIGRYKTVQISDDVVKGGKILNPDVITDILKAFKEEENIKFVRASISEEHAYIFESEVPRVAPVEIKSLLEFKLEENVPIAAKNAIFDYDIVPNDSETSKTPHNVVVSVVESSIAETYKSIFENAGLVPMSFEVEAQSISRAVIKKGDNNTYMLVDFGRSRSGISIVSSGIVRFSTTIEIGGDPITQVIKKLNPKEGAEFIVKAKNDTGLKNTKDNKETREQIMITVNALQEEMDRHYLYWHTHKSDSHTKEIKKIILTGGNSNLAGLPEHLAAAMKIPVERGNVWENVYDLSERIPPISREESMGLSSVIGLSLGSFI